MARGGGVALIIEWLPPPFLLPPPLTAWLQHTAVTRIHLCHHPTVGLMSSPVKPLKHSTWAGPTPGPEAQGLPQGPLPAFDSVQGVREARPEIQGSGWFRL